MPDAKDLPNLAEVLPELLERVSRNRQPLLIVLLERFAAERYRGWATQVEDPDHRAGLLACAEREEEIARRVEALDPASEKVLADILAEHPDLPDVNRSLFSPYSLGDQLFLQAQGERAGAAAWRAFAEAAKDDGARETLFACARLEEENAGFVESIQGDVGG